MMHVLFIGVCVNYGGNGGYGGNRGKKSVNDGGNPVIKGQ